MRRIIPIAFAAILAGCANIEYLDDTYSGLPAQTIEANGSEYIVQDNVLLGRLAIVPTMGSTIGKAFASGATFGAYVGTSEGLMRQAVQSYFLTTGQDCRIVDGWLVAEPAWEFVYQCGAQAAD